jgi:hypothetical protein
MDIGLILVVLAVAIFSAVYWKQKRKKPELSFVVKTFLNFGMLFIGLNTLSQQLFGFTISESFRIEEPYYLTLIAVLLIYLSLLESAKAIESRRENDQDILE